MKKKFHISVHKNSQNVHLKLFGKFDDLSACELTEMVNRLIGKAEKIFIHTEALDTVSPDGESVFQRRVVAAPKNIVVTGRHADHFLPDGRQFAFAG